MRSKTIADMNREHAAQREAIRQMWNRPRGEAQNPAQKIVEGGPGSTRWGDRTPAAAGESAAQKKAYANSVRKRGTERAGERLGQAKEIRAKRTLTAKAKENSLRRFGADMAARRAKNLLTPAITGSEVGRASFSSGERKTRRQRQWARDAQRSGSASGPYVRPSRALINKLSRSDSER